MFKKIKGKVVCSLLTAVLFSSSVASAASFNFTNIDYNGSYNNFKNVYTLVCNYDVYKCPSYNYNSNTNEEKEKEKEEEKNTLTKKYPIFNWNIVTTKPGSSNGNTVILPKPEPVKPSTPDVEEKSVEEKPVVEKPIVEKPVVEKPVVEKPTKPDTTTPDTSIPSNSGLSQIEAEVVKLVNIERQKEGLAPLVADSLLSSVARKKSQDMATNNYFSHTSPTYGSPFDMMKSFGVKYNTAGENIARGQLTAQSVMNGWMNSSGHRANIMNPSFKKIGVGMYESSNGRKYWTQMFTN